MVVNDLSTWQRQRTHDPRRLALGSAQWGMAYGIANRHGQPAAREVAAMLADAHAAGVRTIDTARAYGTSEARVGELATDEDGWRIVTKLGPDVHAAGLGLGEVLERVSASLEASRRALRREVLPVLLLHRFAHRHACGGRVWRLLLAERDAGRLGTLGVSAATPEEAWAAVEDPDVEILQVATSLLDLRLYRQGFFDRARELGRRVFVRSVFLQGVAHLSPDHLPAALHTLAEPLRRIRATARELGVPPRSLFLSFVRALPGVSPVIGCETRAQLGELLRDWSAEGVGSGPLNGLVETLPLHDATLIDPSCWPPREAGWGHPPRRPGPSGVATLPA